MPDALSWALLPVGLLLLAAALLLAFQGLACLLPERADTTETFRGEIPRHVVIMPAHDEAAIIETTVKETLQRIGDKGRLLVIADNCTDETAALARAAKAQVVERHHASERGKGFALAHGIAQLADDPPDVVVILDADCKVGADSIDVLATQAHAHQRPIQGRYDMRPPNGAGLKQRMAAFAWDFRARVRAEGYRRAGLPCQLMGSGMAFPWPLLQRVSLANGHLVEDLKLGLDFARIRCAPMLCPAAVVSSEFPVNEQGARSQRQRWEHGHLGMIFSSGPALLWEAIKHRNGALLALVLDMSVPPLAFLAMTTALYTGLLAVLAAAGWIAPWVLVVGLCASAVIGGAVMLGWWLVGRRWISTSELFTVPMYVVGKIPVYLAFLSRKQLNWIRTRRD